MWTQFCRGAVGNQAQHFRRIRGGRYLPDVKPHNVVLLCFMLLDAGCLGDYKPPAYRTICRSIMDPDEKKLVNASVGYCPAEFVCTPGFSSLTE